MKKRKIVADAAGTPAPSAPPGAPSAAAKSLATATAATMKKKTKSKKKFLTIEDLSLRQLCSYNHSRRFLQKNPDIADTIQKIIEKDRAKPCSLRVLEHLVTKYSRYYDIRLNSQGEEDVNGDFYIADEYFRHLPKQDADPCRRGPLIEYKHGSSILETTIPQMASTISICSAPTIKYAQNNFLVIRQHLNKRKKIKTKKKNLDIVLPTREKKAIYQFIPKPYKLVF